MRLQVKKTGGDFQCEAVPGETLLDALRRSGHAPAAGCCGNRRCGHCRVKVIRPDGLAADVLACATPVIDGMTVIVPEGVAGPVIETAFQTEISAHQGVCAAVDIGTTTIAGAIICDGIVTARGGVLNPQIGFGESVIDRIAAAPRHFDEMRRSVAQSVAGLLAGLCPEPTMIDRVAVVGNPVMTLLFEGFDITSLGHAPFTPERCEFPARPAGELGLGVVGPGKLVAAAPLFSGFIGGDLTAGAEAVKLGRTGQPELLIDLGTNCELLLFDGRRILAASAAAGPAFENAYSVKGGVAGAGAIDHLHFRGKSGWSYSVIGGGEARGICGSGLVDLLAEMRRCNQLDRYGRLDRAVFATGRCEVAPGIEINDAAIAELLQAKAAVAAGIGALLAQSGMPSQRLSRLILCGGFAAGLDLDSATAIGLLPAGIPVEQPGNTALAGAVMLAAHPELASAITDRFAGAEEVLLNHTADFEARFADALLLP